MALTLVMGQQTRVEFFTLFPQVSWLNDLMGQEGGGVGQQQDKKLLLVHVTHLQTGIRLPAIALC